MPDTAGITPNSVDSFELDRAARFLAEKLFPARRVRLAFAHRRMPLRPLSAREAQELKGASAHRKAQFRLGRHCAHKALWDLGRQTRELLRTPNGAPGWPKGVTGSLSHGCGLAAAVVAQKEEAQGLGFDIEWRRGAFGSNAWKFAFHANEIERLNTLWPKEAEERAHILFSAKEAAFKALNGAGTPPASILSLRARITGPGVVEVRVGDGPVCCRCRYTKSAHCLFTGAELVADAPL